MKKRSICITIICLVLCLSLGIACTACQPKATDNAWDQLDMLQQALTIIDNNYMDGLDLDYVDYTAAMAVLNNLDPFTGVTTTAVSAASSAGIGISIKSTRYNEYFVNDIFAGFPAAQPQEDGFVLQRGDEIYAVNGNRLRGLSATYYNQYLQGDAGTPLALTIVRDGVEVGTYTYTKQEGRFPHAIYHGNVFGDDSNIGYIRLLDFDITQDKDGNRHSADQDFDLCMQQLAQDNSSRLILDLRGNGGGSTTVLSSIASYFVPMTDDKPVTIMQLQYAKTNNIVNVNVDKDNYIPNLELVILCDGGSASAAEALIGACRAYHPHTTVIGMPTYGKGVFQQTAIPITDNTAQSASTFPDKYYVVMVSGYYYIMDPAHEDGRYCIHGNPLQPDIDVTPAATIGALSQDPELQAALRVFQSAD